MDIATKLAQFNVDPARFFVHRHILPQYACRACETVTAEAVLPAVIDRSLAAPGLLASVVIQKYLDHLPLYRIEQISSWHGVGIARSTRAEWVGRIGLALQPLKGGTGLSPAPRPDMVSKRGNVNAYGCQSSSKTFYLSFLKAAERGLCAV